MTVETKRPVVEAALIYEPESGAIECIASQRTMREEIVQSFGETLLGCDGAFKLRSMRLYDLGVLRERRRFDTEPDDGIEDVAVSMLRLHPVNSTAERITVEKTAEADRDIWSIVAENLGDQALLTDYWIGQARLVIHYKTAESNRVRRLPITITHPYRSTIKEQREIERMLADKYLPRWGLIAQEGQS